MDKRRYLSNIAAYLSTPIYPIHWDKCTLVVRLKVLYETVKLKIYWRLGQMNLEQINSGPDRLGQVDRLVVRLG